MKHLINYETSSFINSMNEGTMSDIHLLAKEVKSEKEFILKFFKEYGDKIKKDSASESWVKSLYSDMNESVLNEDNLNYKDTGLKGGYLRDVKNAVKAIKNALKAGNKKAASRVTIPNYDIIQQRVQQYGLGPNRYDFLDAVKKLAGIDESEINEATDLNDPVLVAYRATSRDLPKLKIPKLKSRRLSFDKYMDLLDARLDIDQQIKDLRDEMAQTLRDMEQEAEPEGGEVADRYGSTMMKQEKEYTKLMAKKDKIMARIDKHKMA